MVTVAKIDGKLVEVIKTATTVAFSTDRDWVMICHDFEKPERKKEKFTWVPAATRFEWIKTFNF